MDDWIKREVVRGATGDGASSWCMLIYSKESEGEKPRKVNSSICVIQARGKVDCGPQKDEKENGKEDRKEERGKERTKRKRARSAGET